MFLCTTEPIKIEVFDISGDVVVFVDDITYAIISETPFDQVDLDTLQDWVENTYYDESYKSEMYTPCYLRPEEFRLENK